MAEPPEFGRLSPQETVEELHGSLAKFLRMSEVSIPEVILEQTDDPAYRQKFPAHSESISDDKVRLFYHRAAVQELTDTYDSQAVYGFVERLYLGGGLIIGGILQQAKEMNAEDLDHLYHALQDTDILCQEVQSAAVLAREDRETLVTALIRSRQQRKIAIGLLRLTTGVCSTIDEETPTFDVLQMSASSDLMRGLRGYEQTKTLFRAAGYSEEDALLRADKWFRDRVTETTIAVCFPMTAEEVGRVLQIAGRASTTLIEATVLEPEDIEEGFRHPKEPE